MTTAHRPLDHQPEAPPARAHWRRWRSCVAGQHPAEDLPVRDREDLVWQLHEHGWTDQQIAAHTRMSLYTTGRIRARLGLEPNTHNQ